MRRGPEGVTHSVLLRAHSILLVDLRASTTHADRPTRLPPATCDGAVPLSSVVWKDSALYDSAPKSPATCPTPNRQPAQRCFMITTPESTMRG